MNDQHFETESLERFIAELKAKGFEQVPERPDAWRGNIHPAFAGLTDATTMDIVIRAGWPFQFPELFVHGVNASHSTPDGYICLWRDGDDSLEWYTLKGFYNRIEEWRHQDQEGWPNQNLTLDAYLNYPDKISITATFDLSALQVEPGKRAELHGVQSTSGTAIAFAPGKSTAPNRLHGIWLHAGTLHGPPPRRLSEVPKHLNRSQAGKLEQGLKDRLKGHHPTKRGYDLILFCWNHNGQPNALALLCDEGNGKTEAFAMMPGPNDLENLMLRAGPDALLLKDKRAVLFGAGALGGYTALTIAQSGIGQLDIVDQDVLLPGNVARHVAGHTHIGWPKAEAVKSVIGDHASWAKVNAYHECITTPEQIRRLIQNADLVINASGDAVLQARLTHTLTHEKKPLVSGALFRGGAIGRIQRQAHPDDTPLMERRDPVQYPEIPEGDPSDELTTPEAGCSAPVNNAPPAAVISCAARLAQVAIDALTERFQFGDEVISVYRPIETAPFDQIKEMGTPPPPKQQ